MPDLTALPNKLDPKQLRCVAIIETPKNRRNKFDYDPKSNLFELGGLLPDGLVFPYDFGFVPSTLGQDGDPLDCQSIRVTARFGLYRYSFVALAVSAPVGGGDQRGKARTLGLVAEPLDP